MSEAKKRQLLILCIVISLIPAALLMRLPDIVSAKNIALYLSAVTGYIGMTVLLWSYVLGVKSVMSIVFRDLAPVLDIHKWLGKWGTLAIFAHPLLVMFGYGETLFYTIVPELATRFGRHVTLGRIALMIVLLIWVTSAILRSRIKFRPWRYIHLLGYVALPFVFLHIPDVGSQFMGSYAVKIYYFILLLVFAVFALLRLRGLLAVDKAKYQIVAHKRLTNIYPPVWLLQLRPQNEYLAPAKGQYVYLQDGLISEEHPFSVLDYDSKTGDITIAYSALGRFTSELSTRQVGARLLVGGPYGEFTRQIETERKPVVFIAGGIGIAPMVQHLFEKTTDEQWLFYANRTKNNAVFIPQLRQLLGNHLVTIFSRQKDGLDPSDEYGHLTAEIILRHLPNPQKYRYYLCGSPGMTMHTASILASIGVSADSIRCEPFTW